MKNYKYIYVFFLLILCKEGFSQRYKLNEQWNITLSPGATYFSGDLTDNKNKFWANGPLSSTYYHDRLFMIGLSLGKDIIPALGGGIQFLYGNIQGTNSNVNITFSSRTIEANLFFKINFLNLIFGFNDARKFEIYGILGVGGVYYSSSSAYIKKDTNNYGPQYVPNSASGITASFPMGLGLQYDFGKHFRLGLESTYRFVMTDNYDATIDGNKSTEGYGFICLNIAYRFNFSPNFLKRKYSNGFSSQRDNKMKSYKSGTSNGNVKSDPFKGSHDSGNKIYKNNRKSKHTKKKKL